MPASAGMTMRKFERTVQILPSRNMIVALIVATALFMQNLDSTIIATALPTMAESFGETAVHLSLAITAYLLSVAVFIPVSGWVADRFGGREVFCAAITVFTIGSVFCGLSNSLVELTGARIVQGIGGALMVPVGRLVLMRTISRQELVQAMSWLTTPAILGPIIGPPLGGFITTYASWRWIFLLNVPVCLVGIVLVLKMIKNPPQEGATPPLDIVGFGLTAVALSGLMFGLDLLAHPAAGTQVIAAVLAAGMVAGTAAVMHAKRTPFPVLDLRLLEIPTFAVSIWAGTVFRVSAGALPFLLPVMLQVGFGLSAFQSGSITFASAIGALANKMTISRVLRRYGYRLQTFGTAVIAAVSLLACAFFTPATPGWVIIGILLVGGYFRSLQFTSLNSLSFCDIPPAKMSAATTFATMVQQLCNGVGVAFGAILLNAFLLLRGEPQLTTPDFHDAFWVVAAVCLASAVCFLRLKPDAGHEVTGHLKYQAREAPAD
jgi:EmrB/QacA subfamily drug resistance transporter